MMTDRLSHHFDAKTLRAQTVFDNLPAGVYAVAVCHDENSNGKLDRGMFG
jgi:uncharacterized protein (DUF2141 family)